ncbi:MAG: hypothetical protein HUK25_03040 [Treponema sp.]|nr:hypothetical protein [Treponema sp.]
MINSKEELLKQIISERRHNENLFTSFFINASCIDAAVCREAQNIFCSFDIPLNPEQKGDKLLFDKKFYAGKANLLNMNNLIFGFCLYYAKDCGDSLKQFMDRFDFALNQYPNHMEFPQLEDSDSAKVSGVFSAQDIRQARNIAFACRTFYSCGRAVPWFLFVLKPLRITPSAFFADFAEWQRCNNCDYKSGFNPEKEKHSDIEKMQILFLEQKYEEKGKPQMLNLVCDIVRINGAMSRLLEDSNKTVSEIIIKTSYNPDDLFSEEIMNLEAFHENVCMEECSVRLFLTENGPDYEINS